MSVVTPMCPYCGRTSEISVPIDGLEAFGLGAHIQEAFPDLTKEEREMLITGLHPDCFDTFAPEEE